MLPNAIQYSAGCLDYFFRGDIRVTTWRRPGESILHLAVANWSGGPLVGGKFELFWDDAAGTRTKITEWANTTLPSWNLSGDPTNHVYSMTTFEKPPGLSAKSFLVVYKGTINANPTAAADPVDQGIAVTAVRFDPPTMIYRPSSIEFSGVQPGPRTSSYPLNVSFPLTEIVPEYIDPNEPPTLTSYLFRSPPFETTYTYDDADGVSQTAHWEGRVSVFTYLCWRAEAYNAFQNYTAWYHPTEEPVDIGGGRLRLRNYIGFRTEENSQPPSAGGGSAVLTFP
jgi:hypothetical protein